jgi:hypothetical protein
MWRILCHDQKACREKTPVGPRRQTVTGEKMSPNVACHCGGVGRIIAGLPATQQVAASTTSLIRNSLRRQALKTENPPLWQVRGYRHETAIAITLVLVAMLSHATPSLADNPVPIINQPLVPGTAAPGGGALTLTVNGTGFVSGSTVNWNGSPRPTTFVGSSQLTAEITATDVAEAATASVTVVSPAPGGGRSNSVPFSITTSALAILLAGVDYPAGSRSQAIAVADFNGDGKLDLAVGNLDSGTVSVYLGKGDGTFNPRVDFVIGLYPNSITVGDFNGDGNPDLVTANGSGTVSILLGKSDGSFQSHVEYTAGPATFSVAVGDFNGDGKLDLAAANNNSNQGGTVSIFLGNGDGTFQPHVDYPVGTGPYSVAVGDLDKDGKLDLIVANYAFDNSVSVLLGNGDGTFKPQATYAVGRQPDSVAIGDLNGDGTLDLAVAGFADGVVSVLLGNGDGTFKPHVDYPAGRTPSSVIIGDFNGDGKLDLALSNYAPGGVSVPPGYLNILFGNGDGTFQSPAAFVAGPNPATVAVGDFNDDGAPDFVTGSVPSTITATFTVLLQVPQVSLSSASSAFADQWLGTTSTTQGITLTNTGSAPLAISSMLTNGDFAQTNTCGTTVAAGVSCTISLTFNPTASGARSATLTIADNASGSPHTVALSGTGTDFSITATQGTSATVVAGQTATYNLALGGTSGFNGTVALSCSGAPVLSSCTVTPSSISLSGAISTNASVSVSTTAHGMAMPSRLDPPPMLPLTVALVWLVLAALLTSATPWRFRRTQEPQPSRLRLIASLLIVIVAAGAISSCSGGGGGTPAGTYNLTVTATASSGSAQLSHNIQLTLIVK